MEKIKEPESSQKMERFKVLLLLDLVKLNKCNISYNLKNG